MHLRELKGIPWRIEQGEEAKSSRKDKECIIVGSVFSSGNRTTDSNYFLKPSYQTLVTDMINWLASSVESYYPIRDEGP